MVTAKPGIVLTFILFLIREIFAFIVVLVITEKRQRLLDVRYAVWWSQVLLAKQGDEKLTPL